MLDWNTPKLSDKEWIEKCVKESQYIGSDAAFANIYLLRSKYNITLAVIIQGIIFGTMH